MVRLAGTDVNQDEIVQFAFQFQYGAISSIVKISDKINSHGFQFQFGAIRSSMVTR